jgi:ArsR family metal-binding transcriptional regulator
MLNIKILGPGCANCFTLEGLVVAALEFLAEDSSVATDLEDVTLQHLTQREDFERYELRTNCRACGEVSCFVSANKVAVSQVRLQD